jgi:hypothetical protein
MKEEDSSPISQAALEMRVDHQSDWSRAIAEAFKGPTSIPGIRLATQNFLGAFNVAASDRFDLSGAIAEALKGQTSVPSIQLATQNFLGALNVVASDQSSVSRSIAEALKGKTSISESVIAAQKFSTALASNSFGEELTLASRAIADFRMSPEFHAFQSSMVDVSQVTARLGMELAHTLAPLHNTVEEIKVRFASQLDSNLESLASLKIADTSWLRDFKSITAEVGEIASLNFTIPENAVLNWPTELLASRSSLLEDCVLNTVALEQFHEAATLLDAIVTSEQLAIASQFVIDHSEVVLHLPPRLSVVKSGDRASGGRQHRDEEVGAKLELALREIDVRLLELRRQAWRNLAGGIAGCRLAMTGVREIFTDILHALAPDEEVKATETWRDRPKNITKPTRRMRLDYVLGKEEACQADALFQFSESVERTERFVHAFAEDVELVRIQMHQLETWIYLLILHRRA